jgi:hypothetical protein
MSRPIGSEHGRGTVASDIQSAQVGPSSTSMTAYRRTSQIPRWNPRRISCPVGTDDTSRPGN